MKSEIKERSDAYQSLYHGFVVQIHLDQLALPIPVPSARTRPKEADWEGGEVQEEVGGRTEDGLASVVQRKEDDIEYGDGEGEHFGRWWGR